MANKASLDEFIAYLNGAVNDGCVYVWGAQGQLCSEAFITRHETGSDETKALKLYRQRIKDGYDPEKIRAYDCSGLGMYWMQNQKQFYKSDMNANGMKGKCQSITKAQLKRGDWVFRVYKTGSNKGRAYHIGYVVDDELNVVEARGRAYGVQKRKLNASGTGYWNKFGRPELFAEEIEGQQEETEIRTLLKGESWTQIYYAHNTTWERMKELNPRIGEIRAGDKYVAPVWKCGTLLKKGATGNHVRALQARLRSAGYDIEMDGEFGSATQQAVKGFQKGRGLTADGIAGKDTITALGGRWI